MRATPITATVTLILALCRAAHAADEPGIDLPIPAAPAPQDDNADTRLLSPGVALGLSLGATLGTIGAGVGMGQVHGPTATALITLGFAVGPAVGHAYAGEWGHFVITSLARVGLAGGGLTLMALGILKDIDDGQDGKDSPTGTGMMIGGGALCLGAVALAIYDIVDAPRAVRRANRKRTRLSMAPVVTRQNGKTHYGMAVAMQF